MLVFNLPATRHPALVPTADNWLQDDAGEVGHRPAGSRQIQFTFLTLTHLNATP